MITNKNNIPIPLAVWLVNDSYDYQDKPNYISATSILKPLKQIILPSRIDASDREIDVYDFVARATGHAYHEAIEGAWKKNFRTNLKKLGYTENEIDKIVINPNDEDLLTVSANPVYIETRAFKEFEGYTIGGMSDMIYDGILHDFKSTSAYVWKKGVREEEHCRQGSIYRWLNQDKVKEDFIRICYIFTDWQKFMARTDAEYPQERILHKDIPLMSISDTEAYMSPILKNITKYRNAPEKDIPDCLDEELWRTETIFKYYADPEKAKIGARSTRTFKSAKEAAQFQMSKGGVGIIIPIAGQVRRCDYCDAFPICTQKDRYF